MVFIAVEGDRVDLGQAERESRSAPSVDPPTDTDAGQRTRLSTDERAKIKELEREVKELNRANEVLKVATSFFGPS